MAIPTDPPYIKINGVIFNKGATTVTIARAPAFSDTFEFTKVRVFDDRNDLILSFRDPVWPKYNVRQFDLFPLTKANIDAIVSFITLYLGQIVTMTAHNVVYSGIISDPKIEIIDEKNDDCNYKVSFTFETETCL